MERYERGRRDFAIQSLVKYRLQLIGVSSRAGLARVTLLKSVLESRDIKAYVAGASLVTPDRPPEHGVPMNRMFAGEKTVSSCMDVRSAV